MTDNAPAPAHELVPDAWTLARDLARAGHSVALDGIVAHRAGAKTLACYTALAAISGLAGLVWPGLGVVALLALSISAVRDLDGGDGFIRQLLVRDIGHTIIIWPPNEAPDADVSDQRTLLITAPLEDRVILRATPTWLFAGLLFVGLTNAVGCVLAIAWPGLSEGLVLGASGILLVASIVSCSFYWLRPDPPPGNPARRTVQAILDNIEHPDRVRIVFALTGGGTLHHDGMELLLRNHQNRLPPDKTRVLVLHPSESPIAIVEREGRARPVTADPWLVAAAKEAGMNPTHDTTGAARALRHGWKAAALIVASDQTHLAAQVVRSIIEHVNAEDSG